LACTVIPGHIVITFIWHNGLLSLHKLIEYLEVILFIHFLGTPLDWSIYFEKEFCTYVQFVATLLCKKKTLVHQAGYTLSFSKEICWIKRQIYTIDVLACCTCRKRLFMMINDLPTIHEVVTGVAKKNNQRENS
jgi:hypothetical protein